MILTELRSGTLRHEDAGAGLSVPGETPWSSSAGWTGANILHAKNTPEKGNSVQNRISNKRNPSKLDISALYFRVGRGSKQDIQNVLFASKSKKRSESELVVSDSATK